MFPVAVRWSLRWRAAELPDPPSPSLTIFICPPFVSPPPPRPSLVLFPLLFSPSLSGRATRGGPSHTNPEPTGTRGSAGCNSESLNSGQAKCLFKEVPDSTAEFLLNAVERVARVLSRRVALWLTETIDEVSSVPLAG